MAIKTSNGKYFSGMRMSPPDYIPSLVGELTDIRSSKALRDCKYCYTDNAPTVESHEHVCGHTVQLLCALCGAGLTTPAEVTV